MLVASKVTVDGNAGRQAATLESAGSQQDYVTECMQMRAYLTAHWGMRGAPAVQRDSSWGFQGVCSMWNGLLKGPRHALMPSSCLRIDAACGGKPARSPRQSPDDPWSLAQSVAQQARQLLARHHDSMPHSVPHPG